MIFLNRIFLLGAFIFLHETFSTQKLLSSMSYAIGDLISFYILRDFDAASFTVYLCIIPVITLLILRPKTIYKLAFYTKPWYAFSIATVSLNDTLATLAMYIAYQVGRNASQIAPITGTQTIISVLLAVIILKEKNHIVQKILGAIVVVVGVMLVL